jgi:phosphoenolpyruvate---glycerone phosphotransferase subunit DhaL
MAAVDTAAVRDALLRVGRALEAHAPHLTELDQAVGDGDLGITAGKMAAALASYASDAPRGDDVGTYLAQAGMAVNRAASSSLGTLLSTAAMRAGKEVRGQARLDLADLARMLAAAEAGVRERGKAQPGDKTIVDVLQPASAAFTAAVAEGADGGEAGGRALAAARAGRDAVTPLRSRIGRAGWVGERTIGRVDPGCEAGVIILAAIVGEAEA